MHVESVLGDVPKAKRCSCRDDASAGASSSGGSGARWWELWK